MVKYEDDCVGCPTEMGCLGTSCPNQNVPHWYCDKCGSESDELRDYYGEEFCFHCWKEEIEDDLRAEYEKLDLVNTDD